MNELVLYTYWRSSSAFRLRILLGAKGLAYTPVYVNILEGEHRSDAHMARNPMGFVPALSVDGTMYVESVAIAELLEDLAPRPAMLPADAKGRARVRELVQLVCSGIQPLQNISVQQRDSENKSERAAWTRHFIEKGLGAYETLLERNASEGKDGPYAYGDTFTMADAFLVPQVFAARRFGVEVERYPRITRADVAAMQLPYVRDASPSAQGDAKP